MYEKDKGEFKRELYGHGSDTGYETPEEGPRWDHQSPTRGSKKPRQTSHATTFATIHQQTRTEHKEAEDH